MEYRVLTFGPWECDGPDAGAPIYLDGSLFNGAFFAGNPTLDGVGPEGRKRKHRLFPMMEDAPRERLVKARP